MNINDIKEIIKAFDNSNASFIKLENESGKIEMKKDFAEAIMVNTERPAKSSAKTEDKSNNYVKSPIVGIAYKSSKPDAEPFVTVGQKVSKGQILCIVEAMKMFNEIKSPVSGEIVAVLFEDGQLIEYDTPLFEIKE